MKDGADEILYHLDKGSSPRAERIGMAVASLVLGVVSISVSIFLTGALFGIAGAILGIISLSTKSEGKSMAGWGIGLSLLGIMASSFFGIFYYGVYAHREKGFNEPLIQTSWAQKWVGKQAPDFNAIDIEGKAIKLSALRGRKVVLNFWYPGALECRDAIPYFVELSNTAAKDQLAIIGISTSREKAVKGVGRQLGVNYPLISDANMPEPYNEVFDLPTTFFIDAAGKIEGVLEGYHDCNELKLKAASLLSEKADSPSDTKIRSQPL